MIAERMFRSSERWLFAALAGLLILGLQFGGEPLRLLLQYDRAALQAGEGYRLLTGHWVHISWWHALMNVAGLGLLACLDLQDTRLAASLLRCAWLCLAVGLALYGAHPELDWYLGFSGVLHGLFVIALLGSAWTRRDRLSLFVLAVLLGKLAWEHYHGALTQGSLGAPVIVAAHSYGALAGLLYAMLAGVIAWGFAHRSFHSRK